MNPILQYPSSNARIFVTGIFITFLSYNSLFAQSGNLHLRLSDIRSDRGNILVAIYDHPEQWTDEPMATYNFKKNSLKEGTLDIKIENLPYGKYAIAILDDENRDGDMTFKLGIPVEGWGISQNPSFLRLKKPDYDLVCFSIEHSRTVIPIKLNYLGKGKNEKK